MERFYAWSVFATASILCFSSIPSTFAISPYLEFHEINDCGGNGTTIFLSNDSLDSLSVKNASSVRIVGLWKLTIYKPEGIGLVGLTILHYLAQPPDGICVNKEEMVSPENPENYGFYLAENLNPMDLKTDQILFTTEEFYKGLRYRQTGENATVVPREMAMQSVIMFGNGNTSWLVYPQHNFQGTPICICAKHSNEEGFTHINPTSIIVGSVRTTSERCECMNEAPGDTTNNPNGGSNVCITFLLYVSALLTVYFA